MDKEMNEPVPALAREEPYEHSYAPMRYMRG